MRQRLARRKRKCRMQALAKGEEPPDPVTLGIATLVAGTATSIATPFINKALTPKPPKLDNKLTPVAGEDTSLKPGEKVNLINTSPQGVLESASTGRKTILGG